ncbi:MAG: Ger(x)C family spore germination protein [Bacillota bacterium]
MPRRVNHEEGRRFFARCCLGLVLASSLFLSGCWGYREIDETAHVLLLGVDKGKENVLTLTALIAVPRRMGGGGGGGAVGGGGGGGGGQKPSVTISVESRTILTGLDMINSVIERRSTLNHLKVILFSREIAREGLDRYLAPLMRYPEFRRTVFIGISRTSARELLEKFQPLMEANPAKYAELFMGTQRYVGFIPFNQVHHFYGDMKSKSIQPVCALIGLERKEETKREREARDKSEGDFIAGQLPRKGGNKIELAGSAVFRGARMVGTINGSETVILNMLRGWFREGFYAFPDPARPDRFVILRLQAERKPQIKVRLNPEGAPVINVRVPLDAEIISIQSGINYERPEKLPVLERELDRRLEAQTKKLIRKTKEEFRSDIFGFGFKARRLAATYPQWQKMNWPELYPQASVHVTFATQIRRIGLLRKTSKAVGT